MPLAAGVAHGVDGPFEAEAVCPVAVALRHAAPGRQGAVVAIATICLETQLIGGALCQDELEPWALLSFPLLDGAVVAEQVFTEQRGEEEGEPQGSNTEEATHLRPSGERLRRF